MIQRISLTKGAFSLLKRRYTAVLGKCLLAASCSIFLAVPSLANIPAPGSSFSVNENMSFKNEGSLSYGNITGGSGFTLSLEQTSIDATSVSMEGIKASLTDAALSSAEALRVNETTLASGHLKAAQNIVLSAPLNVLSGHNSLTSTGKDIYLGYGVNISGSATLDLQAAGEITGAEIRGTNLNADYVTAMGDVNFANGEFTSQNKFGPTSFYGGLELDHMTTKMGMVQAAGNVSVTGGSFSAGLAVLMGNNSFANAQVSFDQVVASNLELNGGSLEISSNTANAISHDLTLRDADTTIGNLKVEGGATVRGGSFKADTIELNGASFSSVQASMANPTLNGPLSVLDQAVLTAPAEALATQPLSIRAGTVNAEGDFAPTKLEIDGSALNVSGALDIGMPDFQLADSNITAKGATLGDFISTGQSSLQTTSDITLQNTAVNSGRLIVTADLDAGIVKGETLQLQNGAAASIQASRTSFANIQGAGSLSAHNLTLSNDMNLAGGNLVLTGQTSIEGNLGLERVKGSVNDLEVMGTTDLKASSLTGRNITLGRGATLDETSVLEARSLVTGGDIILANNAELLAGDISMGSANLILEGAQGQRAIAAVGDFGNGDMTVDANSLLSIGNTMPDWTNMGMDGHGASAALGLWTPFELAAGAHADVGAGSIARARSAGANTINFTSDSLLITNARVASRDGAGAISAQNQANANVAAGAHLHILQAQSDGLYRVLGENITVNYEGDAWQGDNVNTDSRLIKLERLGGDKLGWFQAKKVSASDSLPGLTPPIGPGIDDAGDKGQIPPETDFIPSTPITPSNPSAPDKPVVPDTPERPTPPDTPETPPTAPDTPVTPPTTPDTPETPPSEPDTPETPPEDPDTPAAPDEPYLPVEPDQTPPHVYTPGQRFLSRALNFWFIGHDGPLAAKTIESACRIFALGAVPELTVAANQAGYAAMQARMGAASPATNQAINSDGELIADNSATWHGFALWITPLYKSVNGYSLSSGNWDTDVNGGLGGVALGGDYTFENNLRLGLSFNIGGGYSHGNGSLADTTNSMSFWGLGAYAGWNWDNLDISADVAYTSTYNKLKQELPSGMQMDDLKSDITAWALSAGVDLGWTLRTDYVDIRPHAGARYTCLYNDSYDVNSGGTVLEGKAKSANVWTFPVGMSFQKQFTFDNGWRFEPMLDLAVIPAAGENKTKTEVRYTGTDTWMNLKDQFMDDISYRGSFGMKISSDNISLGVNYSMQAGAKTNSQTVMGSFVYSF